MNKIFFYAAYIFAVCVFFMFFSFMLWQGMEMANQMGNAAVSPTFWTVITDIGLFSLSAAGLFLFIVAAYIAFVRGYKTSMPAVASTRLTDVEPPLPTL